MLHTGPYSSTCAQYETPALEHAAMRLCKAVLITQNCPIPCTNHVALVHPTLDMPAFALSVQEKDPRTFKKSLNLRMTATASHPHTHVAASPVVELMGRLTSENMMVEAPPPQPLFMSPLCLLAKMLTCQPLIV